MRLPLLTAAVVGHTNTGKTSLLRTLTRDVGFGQVSARPATTHHVEGTSVLLDGRTVMELFDTPGLEDSIGLLDHLDALAAGRRVEGIDVLNQFLQSAEAWGRFSQEAKAIRQVIRSDIALYVIDARDRVLGKHRDELEILSRCATPVVPVLNFTADPDAKVPTWREHLARVNMHAVAEFDTVVLDEASEQRLYEKMRTMLDSHEQTLRALIEERRRQREALIQASADVIGDLLIDVAAHTVCVRVSSSQEAAEALQALRERVRLREQRCVDQLLELFRFRPDDCPLEAGALINGRWGLDLFSPEALKQFGLHAGGGAAAGALVGLVLDVMAGGATLGAGTAAGATIGGLLGAGRTHGRRLISRARGTTELRCEDATLRLLAMRQIMLTRALLHRGHADMNPLPVPTSRRFSLPKRASPHLPLSLQQAKMRSHWSRLDSLADSTLRDSDPARQTAKGALAKMIAAIVQRPSDADIEFP